jgi:hypothetical protein
MKVTGVQTKQISIELSKGEQKRVVREYLRDLLSVKAQGHLTLDGNDLVDHYTHRTTYKGDYCIDEIIKKDLSDFDKAVFMVYKEINK